MLPKHKTVVKKWKPTPRQVEVHRINKPTLDWIFKLTAAEMQPYAGQWVAAQNCRIIASAPTEESLAPHIAHLDRATVIVHKIENRWMVR